jgi:ATP-dependent helicase/nuclease subunit A
VRCVLLTPHNVGELLPPDDRAPAGAALGDVAPAGVQPPLHAPVEAAGALPVSRLSYSGLASYARCGYRFYLERVLRLRESAPLGGTEPDPAPLDETGADEFTPLLRGSIVHELLERLDFARPALPPRDEVAERIAAHGVTASESDLDDLLDMVSRFVDSPLRARLAATRRTRRELPFAFTVTPEGAGGRSLLMNGVVDVHAREGDDVLIVDYKSDVLGDASPEALIAEMYDTQRLVYALAALRSGAPRVEVAYCFLERPDEPVTATYEKSDEPGLERRLLGLAAGVMSGGFEPTDMPHRELCVHCPGQPALCSWPPERTLAPRDAVPTPSDAGATFAE